MGALDATVHSRKAAEYGIQGYPTIKYFPAGKKLSSSSAEEYNGGRTANDIVNWALEKHSESLPAPEIKQVITLCENFTKYLVKIWKSLKNI